MITLASDFGSPYPAAMTGVLLRRTDARLVDVSHDLPRQDVRGSAFWLRFVLPEFPPAVHLVVVDPGVGTDRGVRVVRAGEHTLVGPDNGVLLPPARALAGDDALTVYAADPGAPDSSTFHGRDVFAPLAGDVHEADSWDEARGRCGLTRTDDYVDLRLPEAVLAPDHATGEVLVVDDFGNSITTLPGSVLDGHERVRVNGQVVPVVTTFAEVDVGDPLVTVGSHGYVECDVNRGRGDEAFDLTAGASVRVAFGDDG